MATIRDVVEALARRGGIDAVVVVGRDGLPIDARAADGLDAENVAAAVVSVLNADALLVVLVRPSTNVGTLLYDLRRHRSAIAGLL